MPTGKYPPPVEWAFYTLVAFLTGLAAAYPSPLFILFQLVFPLPLLLAAVRLDLRYALLSLLAAGGALAAFLPPVAAFSLAVQDGLPGIVFGLLFKNNVSSARNLLFGTVATVAVSALTFAAVYAFTGVSPLALTREESDLIRQWFAVSVSAGPAAAGADAHTVEKFIFYFGLLKPGMFLISILTTAVLTYFLGRALLARLHYSLPGAPVFSRLVFPWYVSWVLIAGLLLTLLGDHFGWPLLARAGRNILLVYAYFSFFAGLSVAVYYYNRLAVPRPLKMVLAASLALYLPFCAALLVIVGAADPLLNLRRLPQDGGG